MKKLYFLLSLLLLAGYGLQAQQTIFNDDFDGYTAGEKLAQQAGTPWTTWSNNPGSGEDPVVSDAQANNGSNSVKIASGNDCVLLLDDNTSGRYKFSFYIYVPSGKVGYYNLLADFAGSNSQWATQVFFDGNGQGTIDAGGEGAGTFTYNYDSWFLVENYVDLNNDWGETFIDGTYVIGWQWTLGTFGDPVPMQLSAANFYAWDVNGTPEYYFDELVYEEMPIGDAPQNLQASVDGSTVTLSWEAPANGSPFTYYIFRNGDLVAIDPDLTTDDVIEFPGTYNYEVKAMYDPNGLSEAAGPVEVIIEGGTDREKVLLEIGTGTWCVYCPGSAMGADDLIENGKEVAVIEYHGGDNYETSQSAARLSYYDVSSYPTSRFDGIEGFSGGNATQSLYTAYLPYYNSRIATASVFGLQMDANLLSGGNDFEVVLSSEQMWDYSSSDLRLHLVLTESHIPENWFVMDELNFVCREMYPNATGTALSLENNGDTQEDTFTISVSEAYDIAHCELVAFIQDNDTKEVMNATFVDLGQIVGIAEKGELFTRVYPNPAAGSVTIESASTMKHIRIYNLNGQKVYEVALDQQKVNLNIDFLNQGLYMIALETVNGNRIEKLNVR